MSTPHQVNELFQGLLQIGPYGEGMVAVPSRLPGLAFFPGGDGLWKERRSSSRSELPVGKIMVIGNNFQCTSNFALLEKVGEEDPWQDPTWRNLLELFEEVAINKSDCFYTNAFMGLVKGDDPTITVPGMSEPGFLSRCQDFMKAQIALLQPRLILALGKKVPAFLAPLANLPSHWKTAKSWREIDGESGPISSEVFFPGVAQNTTVVCLLHPCLRKSNLRFRSYGTLTGSAAELALLREAVDRSGTGAASPRQEVTTLQVHLLTIPKPSTGCVCCMKGMTTATPRVCPSCGMVFHGHGWAGFGFHWRSTHESEMTYEEARDSLCPEHGGRSYT